MRMVAAGVAVMMLATAAAAADPNQESREKQQQAQALAVEATQKFMQAIELMIQALPQYGMPRIDDQGNIVIPRLPNATPKPKPPVSGPDGDSGTPDKTGTKL